jgi:hypothetical protein
MLFVICNGEGDISMEHHKRVIKGIEEARGSSVQRLKSLPGNATIRKEYVKCGKDNCVRELEKN